VIIQTWQNSAALDDRSNDRAMVVFTGGEPLLQLDKALIDCLHQANFTIAIETNGTIKAPDNIDWICVSPKDIKQLKQRTGNELKLLYPLANLAPESFSTLSFDHFYLQAVDEQESGSHMQETIDYCMQHPQWQLSLQTHKLLGLK